MPVQTSRLCGSSVGLAKQGTGCSAVSAAGWPAVGDDMADARAQARGWENPSRVTGVGLSSNAVYQVTSGPGPPTTNVYRVLLRISISTTTSIRNSINTNICAS